MSRDRDAGAGMLGTPDHVVHPASTDEVASTMRSAAARGLGVAVMASGSRFRGAPRVDRPFMVMRTDRLTGTEIYEPADLTLTAKAGTPLSALADELGAHGQWLPYDPPRVDERTLGGLVASGESGPLWMGFGELRNHVLGVTIVCGDGRVLRLGGRVVKNVAGFDLLKAVVGSRGRLGVITSVCVRVFPRFAVERVLILEGASAAALAEVAAEVGTAPVMPVSCVLVSPAAMVPSGMSPALSSGGPLGGSTGAALLVRLHGAEPAVAADQRTLERHCGVRFASAADPAGLLAAARDQASNGPVGLEVSVLPSRLAGALAAVDELLEDASIVADAYRGSLRATSTELDSPTAGRLRERVEALGGTLSVRATNGDEELSNASSRPNQVALDLTARVETVFDPERVLWPCRS